MKMIGRLKRRGHCRIPGHGQRCSLTREVREATYTRAQEKRAWRAEAK